MEFKKLSDVTLAEKTNEHTNVLIEDNGEVKKVAMDQIKVPQKPQVQADWNETDKTNPAFILNKPEKLGGGYTYFAFSEGSGYMCKLGSGHELVSRAEFEEAYRTSPIMLVIDTDNLQQDSYYTLTPRPCIMYHLNTTGGPKVAYVNYDGYGTRYRDVVFSDGGDF